MREFLLQPRVLLASLVVAIAIACGLGALSFVLSQQQDDAEFEQVDAAQQRLDAGLRRLDQALDDYEQARQERIAARREIDAGMCEGFDGNKRAWEFVETFLADAPRDPDEPPPTEADRELSRQFFDGIYGQLDVPYCAQLDAEGGNP